MHLSKYKIHNIDQNARQSQVAKRLPRGPEQGSGRCLRSRGKCRCQTAAAWSESASACSAGEPHRWPAAAGLPAMKKRKRMARYCTAVVAMALRSGSVGNGDSHWSLQRKKKMDVESTDRRTAGHKLHIYGEQRSERGPYTLWWRRRLAEGRWG